MSTRCNHSNPANYVFCSTCGQALNHKRCRCGFVCMDDAFYCGRCGNSLEINNELTAVSAVAHRYDLDLLVKCASVLLINKSKGEAT